MALTSTATSNFSSTVTALVERRLEEALRARYPHAMPGNFIAARKMGNGTNSLTFVGYSDLAATTVALTEGTAPTDQTLAIVIDTCTATQIGNTIALTDLAEVESPHDLIAVAADKAADQAAKSIDVLVREILAAGASVQYAGTATSRATVATSHVLTGALVKKMWTILQRNNVPTFSDGLYRCIIHPDSLYDLQTDTANGGWMDALKYTTAEPLLTNEVGRYGGVRFQISSQAKVFTTAGAGSANVYSAFFFGPDAYVVGDLQSVRAYFVPAGGDHSDPIAQKALVGWKTAFGSMLADANGVRYVRLEHGTTLNLG
jgi:N4-gp56 family major capsid protein